MKHTEEWRKLFFDLSDQAFFDLVRNYLGDIHTPFNKHKLLEQLEAFLLKKSNLEQIISMIDSADAALLTAVDCLGKASIEQLYTLFGDEEPYYSFYTHFMDLEERLLICPVREEKGGHTVVLSPLFRDVLRQRVIDMDLFLGCQKASIKKPSKYAWYEVPVIAAYLSSFMAKKGKTTGVGSSPNLAPEDGEIIKKILIKHSLLYQTGRQLLPVKENFRNLFSLTNSEVSQSFIQSYLAANPLEALIYKNMRADRCYSDKAFARLVRVTAYLAGLEPGDIQTHKMNLVQAALVAEENSGLIKLAAVQGSEAGKIVVQPDFSLYVQGALSIEENITLSFFAEIRELDIISRWEVTRESFMRGIRSGTSAATFIRLLEEKSGSPLPQNILFSYKSWEEECQGIAVYRGCVIKVDGRFSQLLENNAVFKGYVKEKLSEGIYLVLEQDFPEAMKVVANISGQSLALPLDNRPWEALPPAVEPECRGCFQYYEKPDSEEQKGTIPDKFLKKIETLDITDEQKDILSAKVNRKLILSEKQLENGDIRYELMEAGGIDYNKKVRLCQHVIEVGGAFLELTLGDDDTLLINPLRIKKMGNDMVVIGDEIPVGGQVQVPLRKVRYMRKIRTSLMG